MWGGATSALKLVTLTDRRREPGAMRYHMGSLVYFSVHLSCAGAHIRSRLHIHTPFSSSRRSREEGLMPMAIKMLVATVQPRSDARGAGLRQHS